MRVSDHRYDPDRRKHALALWMISHGARTRTITQWTGLSRARVQKLARRFAAASPGDHRRRGVSPCDAGYFGHSERLEAESLALAFIASEMQVLPEAVLPDARRGLPDLDRGERLRMAYEWYQSLVPDAQISLERTILFLIELAQRRQLTLRRCKSCPDILTVERQGVEHDQCPFCRQEHRTDAVLSDESSCSAARDAQRP